MKSSFLSTHRMRRLLLSPFFNFFDTEDSRSAVASILHISRHKGKRIVHFLHYVSPKREGPASRLSPIGLEALHHSVEAVENSSPLFQRIPGAIFARSRLFRTVESAQEPLPVPVFLPFPMMGRVGTRLLSGVLGARVFPVPLQDGHSPLPLQAGHMSSGSCGVGAGGFLLPPPTVPLPEHRPHRPVPLHAKHFMLFSFLGFVRFTTAQTTCRPTLEVAKESRHGTCACAWCVRSICTEGTWRYGTRRNNNETRQRRRRGRSDLYNPEP